MKTSRFRFPAAFLALATAVACATTAPTPPHGQTGGDGAPAATGKLEGHLEIGPIRDAWTQGAFAVLISAAKEALKRAPSAEEAPEAMVYLGRALLTSGARAEAETVFQETALKFPGHPLTAAANAYLGIIALERGKASEAVAQLAPVANRLPPLPGVQAEAIQALARAYLGVKEYARAVAAYGKYYELAATPKERERVRAETIDLIENRLAFEEIAAFQENIELAQFVREPVLFKLALIHYHARNFTKARDLLQGYLKEFPAGEFASRAKQLLEIQDQRAQLAPGVIGVLLPLSGEFSHYGRKVLRAMRLGLELGAGKGEPGGWDQPGAIWEAEGMRVIIADSKGTPEGARQAVENLVLEHHVVGLLGDIRGGSALAAAAQADAFEVPIIALAQPEELTGMSPWVFRNCLTNSQQARAIARYAVNVLKIKNFGILYPNHPYGVQLMQYFWDEVEALGGSIKAVQEYGSNQTDFSKPAKKLAGKFWLGLRGDYYRAVAEETLGKTGVARQRAAEKAAKNVPPVVEFDGLFIPDYYKTVSMVAPAVAYEDVFIWTTSENVKYRFMKATGQKHPRMVRLLGANGWNNPKIVERGALYVRNAVFVDGFHPDAPREATRNFVLAYRSHIGPTPSVLEAQAYDSIRMYWFTLKNAGGLNREGLRDALRGLKNFPGATGTTSFGPGGDAEKELEYITITDDRLELLQKPGAAQGFEGSPPAP